MPLHLSPQVFEGIHQNCGREFQDYLAWHRLNPKVHAHHASHFAELQVTTPI